MIKLFKYVLILFSFVFCEDKNSSVFVDGIAAVVGEHVILKSDVAQLVNIAAVQQRLNPAVDMKKLLRTYHFSGMDRKIPFKKITQICKCRCSERFYER